MYSEFMENIPKNKKNKLLTIAIPTYNRAVYLDLCLRQICKQLPENQDYIELIVSDNASTDSSGEIVQKYISKGHKIIYVRNVENLVADNNIAQAFSLASSKYVLVFADDDVLVDGALAKIIEVLLKGEYGIVHLQSYPYQTDFAREHPRRSKRPATVEYDNVFKFIQRVNYYFTFISGNIINKSLVDKDMKINDFSGTNMIQLSWTYSALFNSRRNVYIGQNMVAAKGGNSGGYQVCKVFGANVKKMSEYFIKRGIHKKYFDVMNRNLLFSFFPDRIRGLRRDRGNYHEEKYFEALFPNFGRYANFWLFTAPAIILPLALVRWEVRIIRNAMNLKRIFGNLNDNIFHRTIM